MSRLVELQNRLDRKTTNLNAAKKLRDEAGTIKSLCVQGQDKNSTYYNVDLDPETVTVFIHYVIAVQESQLAEARAELQAHYYELAEELKNEKA